MNPSSPATSSQHVRPCPNGLVHTAELSTHRRHRGWMRTGEDRLYQRQRQVSARASVERWPWTCRAGLADRGEVIVEGSESG